MGRHEPDDRVEARPERACHTIAVPVCPASSVFGTAKATQEADNLVILQRGKKYRFLDVKKNRYDGELGTVPYRYDKASGRVRAMLRAPAGPDAGWRS